MPAAKKRTQQHGGWLWSGRPGATGFANSTPLGHPTDTWEGENELAQFVPRAAAARLAAFHVRIATHAAISNAPPAYYDHDSRTVILNGYRPDEIPKTVTHELGHAMDDSAGELSTYKAFWDVVPARVKKHYATLGRQMAGIGGITAAAAASREVFADAWAGMNGGDVPMWWSNDSSLDDIRTILKGMMDLPVSDTGASRSKFA